MLIEEQDALRISERVFSWCERRRWEGIDPYDFIGVFSKFSAQLSHPIFMVLDGFLGLNLTRVKTIQRALRVADKLDPKAIAVAARACFRIAKVDSSEKWNHRGTRLVSQLLRLQSASSSHVAWGLPFAWTTAHAQRLEAGHPVSVVTALGGLACLDAFEATRNRDFLGAAREAATHLIQENGYWTSDKTAVCFWYGYRIPLCLNNSNLLIAGFLKRIQSALHDDWYGELAERATRFTLREQNSDGSWYYFARPTRLNRTIDNYHTGFVISALLELKRNGMEGLDDAIDKGLRYYSRLFNSDGSSLFQPGRLFPIDIHDLSQGIVTFAESADSWEPGEPLARKVLNYTCNAFLDSDGAFNYRIYYAGQSRTKFLRWSQAWMLFALATALHFRVLGD